MNIDSLEGTAGTFGGKIKETVGGAIGDRSLQADGVADQVGGTVQKAVGDAVEAVEDGIRPLIDTVRQFARERPFAAAAIAGVLGIALLNTLRGE